MASSAEKKSNLMISRPWSELAKSVKRYCISKAQEGALKVLVYHFLRTREHLSLQNRPILCKWMWSIRQSHTTVGRGILRHGRQKQLQILSLFPSKFIKQKLLQFVSPLTQSKIDTARARKHASVKGPGQILNPPKIYRICLTRPNSYTFWTMYLCPRFPRFLVLVLWYHTTSFVELRTKIQKSSEMLWVLDPEYNLSAVHFCTGSWKSVEHKKGKQCMGLTIWQHLQWKLWSHYRRL